MANQLPPTLFHPHMLGPGTKDTLFENLKGWKIAGIIGWERTEHDLILRLLLTHEQNIAVISLTVVPLHIRLESLAVEHGVPDVSVEPPRRRNSIPTEKIVAQAESNHIWLNAFLTIRPTDEFCAKLGREVLNMLRSRENLLMDEETGSRMLFLSVHAS